MDIFKQPANLSDPEGETSRDPLASRRASASSGHSLHDVVALSNSAALLTVGTAIGADQHCINGASPETPLDRAIRRLLHTNRDQVQE